MYEKELVVIDNVGMRLRHIRGAQNKEITPCY